MIKESGEVSMLLEKVDIIKYLSSTNSQPDFKLDGLIGYFIKIRLETYTLRDP